MEKSLTTSITSLLETYAVTKQKSLRIKAQTELVDAINRITADKVNPALLTELEETIMLFPVKSRKYLRSQIKPLVTAYSQTKRLAAINEAYYHQVYKLTGQIEASDETDLPHLVDSAEKALRRWRSQRSTCQALDHLIQATADQVELSTRLFYKAIGQKFLTQHEFSVLGLHPSIFGAVKTFFTSYAHENDVCQWSNNPLFALLVMDTNQFSKIPFPETSLTNILLRIKEQASQHQPTQSGVIRFDSLCSIDFLLAAMYCRGTRGSTAALEDIILDPPQHWAEVRERFSDDRSFFNFRARGIGPRIAELAFPLIAEAMKYPDVDCKDLNTPSARVDSKRMNPLPASDWIIEEERFDVKSNIYYMSHAKARGIRGYFIEGSSNSKDQLVGIVLSEGEHRHEDIRWNWIGNLCENSGGAFIDAVRRVPVYDFEYPASTIAFIESAHVLEKFADFIRNGQSFLRQRSDFLDLDSLKRDIEQLSSLTPRRVQWLNLAKRALEVAASGQNSELEELLDYETRVVRGRWRLFIEPAVGDCFLVSHWIEEVIRPLVASQAHWKCLSCRSSKVIVTPERLTDGGSIFGSLKCRDCAWERCGVTLVVHCQKCNRYPLVFGREATCTYCSGLICQDGVCGEHGGYCRPGCERNPKIVNDPFVE